MQLEDDIYQHVKEYFIDWRRRSSGSSRTFFRKELESSFTKVLEELEKEAQTLGTTCGVGDGGASGVVAKELTEKHRKEMSRILGRYRTFGVPINLVFRNIDEITEAVRATVCVLNDRKGWPIVTSMFILL